MSTDFLTITSGGPLLAFGGQKTGTLLNILSRIGQPHPQQRIIHSKISIMLRLINPVLEGEQDKFLHSWGLHSSGRDKQGKQI